MDAHRGENDNSYQVGESGREHEVILVSPPVLCRRKNMIRNYESLFSEENAPARPCAGGASGLTGIEHRNM